MLKKLTIIEIKNILQSAPEQNTFDWKQDFNFHGDDEKKSEFVKDISAIANGTILSDGFIFYGVNPKVPDQIIGVSNDIDDSTLQQLVNSKVDPQIGFIKYEVFEGNKKLIVIQIEKSIYKPHIIIKDFGKLRQGQIMIRKGSSTRGILRTELFELFYDIEKSPYFRKIYSDLLNQAGALKELNETIKILKDDEDRIDRDIKRTLGF
jgi:predicted HTH transcriptional regulator